MMRWVTIQNALLLAGLLPLVGFLVLALFGRRMSRAGRGSGGKRAAAAAVAAGGGMPGMVATGFAVLSFAASVVALVLWVAPEEFRRPHYAEAFTYRWLVPATDWAADAGLGRGNDLIARPAAAITAGLLADSLAITMCVIWSFVVVMIHLYATGWNSRHRPDAVEVPGWTGGLEAPRFFSLLQLLSFAMMGLFLSNALVQMLICWQVIAVAAWMLVGMETPEVGEKRAASHLPMLLTQLIGTGAFLAGIALLAMQSGNFSGLAFFDEQGNSILARLPRELFRVGASEYLRFTGTTAGVHWLTWVGICFLIAALTRMAQFPFFHWASATARAQTPAAALLFGAAFLGSGVFLLARIFPLLTLDARLIVAVVGALTAVCAGLIALVQRDVRQVLVWSSVSQGGLMLLFLGCGGYVAAVLHLFTHTFFKTSLLLAGGIVGTGLGSWDLHQMGGLWKRFPMTAAASLVGVLALAGAPWLSGAYSGQLGLACVFEYAGALSPMGAMGDDLGMLLYWSGVATCYLTAMGIGRWWWLIFAGVNRQPKLLEKGQETPYLTLPVFILAGLSVGAWFEFSRVGLLIHKSVPPSIMAAGLEIEGSANAFARAIRDSGWAFLGLGVAVGIYASGLGFAERIRRLPGVNVVDYWLRRRFFLEDVAEGEARAGRWAAQLTVRTVDRVLDASAKMVELGVGLMVVGVGKVERPAKKGESPPSTAVSHEPQP